LNRVAVIDVGTNSVLYLLAERRGRDDVISGHQEIRTTRLGRLLASEGRIGERELAKTCAVLKDFRSLAEHQKADKLVCVGTQAFRKAENRSEALDRILKKSGISVEVLSETGEAEWSFRGAVYKRALNSPVLVADIGGGSTEFVRGESSRPIRCASVPVGAVVLTEKHLHHDPPAPEEYERMDAEIRAGISGPLSELTSEGMRLICVGGTATTLAALELGLESYDPRRVDGCMLPSESVKRWIQRLRPVKLAQKRRMVRIDPERADILTAGLMVLDAVTGIGRFKAFRTSDRGLRFGIALRELNLISRRVLEVTHDKKNS
jgi:exopolyphosphatase/guanosine-5'-triphosphate,3'-diphosphate pyrophosphatase